MPAAISLKNVSFSYAEKPVLRNISAKIEAGTFNVLMGPVACGKTTLLMAMGGLIPNSVKGKFEGEVEVFGENTRAVKQKRLSRKIGFLFQDPDSQLFSLTVRDEVAFALDNFGVKGKEREERIAEALSMLGIENLADAAPSELSVGQKQKVALASILAYGPDILLLDEPVASLDHRSALEIYDIAKRLNEEEGKAIVAVEHDSEIIAGMADRVLVMEEGRMTLDGGRELFFDDRMEKAGLRVPCSAVLARKLGMKVKSEEEFLRKLKGKRGK